MIITNLKGGLGNQMFQYAAALALATKHGVSAKVDLSFLNQAVNGAYTPRSFALNVFEKFVEEANEEELSVFLKIKSNRFQWINNKLRGASASVSVFTETMGTYNEAFEDLPANTFLEGYWQTEKYFEKYADVVRKNFVFSKAIKLAAEVFVKQMQEHESVALHVRRGDYLSNKAVQNFHGVCSPDYYKNAMTILTEKKQDLLFFVFSDDMQWCRDNLVLPANTVFVSLPEPASEMYLMTQCRHNVIANSSFSWWGAWLNNHPDKIVIAPTPWYANIEMNSPDIYSKSWLKL